MLKKNIKVAPFTWFQVGGTTPFFLKAKTDKEILDFLHFYHEEYVVLGAGSNVLIRDEAMDKAIIKVCAHNYHITDHEVIADAGMLDRTFSLEMAKHSIEGFEFLSTIPGTLGGAASMNAGAYDHETQDLCNWVEGISSVGTVVRLYKKDLCFSYRHADIPEGFIITRVGFEKRIGDSKQILAKLQDFQRKRFDSQPISVKTGGSTFKNPPNGPKAWQLIDKSGCRGLKVGDAQINEKHCNFIVNTKNATAYDIETLGNMVQKKVFEKTGVLLEWEIRII